MTTRAVTIIKITALLLALLPVPAAVQSPAGTIPGTQTIDCASIRNGHACSIEPNDFLEQAGIPDGSLIPCVCMETGCCELPEVFQTIVNFSQLILALTGSIALLMIIYGGTMFIIAAGNQERVQKAKQILVAAAVGVAIIFTAWLIVNIVIGALTGGEIHSPARIFNTLWYKGPNGQ